MGLKPWQLIPLALLTFLAMAYSAGSETSVRLIRDAVGLGSVIAATGLGILMVRLLPSRPFGKFILWAGIFATAHVHSVYLLAEIQSVAINQDIIPVIAGIGALIGAGAGLGFELAVIIAGRLGFFKN